MDYKKQTIEKLNEDIKLFQEVSAITPEMTQTFEGIARLIMLDRYSYKDQTHHTLRMDDLVILTTKADPKYPARGIGIVKAIDGELVSIEVNERKLCDQRKRWLYHLDQRHQPRSKSQSILGLYRQ